MMLKEINIENYRSYRGKHTIGLKTSSDRTVVIIYGKNGAGKTGLLNSILWCFYGSTFFGSSRAYALRQLNKHALSLKKPRMLVRVTFEHNGKTWTAERKFEYSGRGSKNSAMNYRGDSGGPIVSVAGDIVDDGYAAIESVLPMNAAHFHFFDGEQMRRYTREKNPDEVKKAIELVLNLPVLSNTRTDLEKTIKEIEDDRSRLAAKNETYSDLLDKRKDVVEQLADIDARIDTQRIDLNRATEELSKIEERLSRFEELKEKIDRVKTLRSRKDTYTEQLDDARSEFNKAIHLLSYSLLNDLLAEGVLEISSMRASIDEKRRLQIASEEKRKTLVKILESNRICSLCGSNLEKAQIDLMRKDLENIEQTLEMSPQIIPINAKLIDLERKGTELLSVASGANREILLIQTNIAKLVNELRGIKQELDELENDIEGVDEGLFFADTRNRGDLRNLIKSYREDIEQLLQQRNELMNSKDEIESELDKTGKGDEEMEDILEEKTRATAAFNAIAELIGEYVEEVRIEIEEKSSEILRRLTNKPKEFHKVTVSSDFSVDIIDDEEKIVSRADISAGEQQVLALSFMAGLASSSDSKGPFLMDTPFGRLDKEHKKNILELIPELSDQVVIFVTDDDLGQYEESILNRRISKILEIKYNQEKKSSAVKVLQ